TPLVSLFLALLPLLSGGGCQAPAGSASQPGDAANPPAEAQSSLRAVEVTDQLTPLSGPLALRGARNEWLDAFVQFPATTGAASFHVTSLTQPDGAGIIPVDRFHVYRGRSLRFATPRVAAG